MQIKWSEQALTDLSEILRYVIGMFGKATADKVNEKIADEINTLSAFPQMGRVLYHDKTRGIIYRTFPTKYHQVVYSADDDMLFIVTLWNSRRDTRKLITHLNSHE